MVKVGLLAIVASSSWRPERDFDCTDIIQIEVLCVSDMVGAMNATNGTN